MGVGWALLGGFLVYGVLKATMGLRLSQEEEYDGADLTIHKISATPGPGSQLVRALPSATGGMGTDVVLRRTSLSFSEKQPG